MKKVLFVFLLALGAQSIYSQCDLCDPFFFDNYGICIIDGGCSNSSALNYSGDDCASATFTSENCVLGAAGCTCPDSYNYDPSANVDDGSCIVLSGGCGDATAENYSGDACATAFFAVPDCQYGSVELGEFSYAITDANMTVQVGADVVTFNGEAPPIGALLGAFFTNDSGELQCAGYQPWTGDQLAIAVWASESGLDNGFAAGESITWGLYYDGESFIADSYEMNSSPPFSNTFTTNGFGQILFANFSGESTQIILGCTDSEAYNYDSNATIDDASCIYLGCVNPDAINYDLNASVDDGSCILAPWSIDYTITGCNTTLGINADAIATIDGAPLNIGDLIGVFYNDLDGNLACAGLAMWSGENISIPIWGDDMTTEDIKEGFSDGEEMIFQLWNSVTDEIINNVSLNFATGDNFFQCPDIIVLDSIIGFTIITQEVMLPEGWFIFSTYLNLSEGVDEIFSQIGDDLVILKNDNGDVYWPSLNINEIGYLIDGEGYELKMSSSNVLYLESYQLATNQINIDSGWSMIAYLNQEMSLADEILSPISTDFTILKNYEGDVYWPELEIDQIGFLNPGFGYWIYTENNLNFSYQGENARISLETDVFNSKKFKKPINTGNNMVVGIIEGAWDLNIEEGDELVVCDGSGMIVGNALYKKSGTAITVWGDDPTTIAKEGLIEGEKLNFKLYSYLNDKLNDIKILSWESGSGYYSVNGISVAEKITLVNRLENQKQLVKITDLLGKEITNKGFQLHIYDDGSVEKKYVIE